MLLHFLHEHKLLQVLLYLFEDVEYESEEAGEDCDVLKIGTSVDLPEHGSVDDWLYTISARTAESIYTVEDFIELRNNTVRDYSDPPKTIADFRDIFVDREFDRFNAYHLSRVKWVGLFFNFGD